ncbi:MAG: alanine racemase, partial [Candidatus Neomarinimicrobiota bacterium]
KKLLPGFKYSLAASGGVFLGKKYHFDLVRPGINLYGGRKKYSSFQEGIAAMFACKAAIKAGDSLMREEMQELVNRLFSTKHPYYCPHGRPIIVQMSLDELDGRFERH